jgi:hypothetical protein
VVRAAIRIMTVLAMPKGTGHDFDSTVVWFHANQLLNFCII